MTKKIHYRHDRSANISRCGVWRYSRDRRSSRSSEDFSKVTCSRCIGIATAMWWDKISKEAKGAVLKGLSDYSRLGGR